MDTDKQDHENAREGFTLLEEQAPARERRATALRVELLLGCVLVAIIVIWAGWDAWRNQEQLHNYQAGEQYVARNDWDGARASFSESAMVLVIPCQ